MADLDATLSADGGPRPEPDRIRPGAVVDGRYELRAELGRGAFGVVYRAHDRLADTEVAIKVLAVAVSPERLRRELRAAWTVTHPGVVRVYDVIVFDDRIALTMELVDGETLDDHLARTGPLAPAALAALASDLAEALAAAHAAGVIHRDLKPSNILIRAATGRAVITDFGLSRVAGADDESAGDLRGTPAFMAPEQLRGAIDLAPAADVYALGLVLFEAATGARPHPHSSVAELVAARHAAPPPSIAKQRADLPPQLARTIDACLATEVRDRIADGRALVVRLATPRPRRWWIAGAVAGAGAIAIAALAMRTPPAPGAPPLTVAMPATGPVQLIVTVPGTLATIVQAEVRAPDRSVLIAGHTTSPFAVEGVSAGQNDNVRSGFVVAIAPSGAVRWHREIGGPRDMQLIDLARAGGNAIAVGVHHGGYALGNGLAIPPPPREGFPDGYIVAFDERDGATRWVQVCNASEVCQPRSIVGDAAGNVYVSGEFMGDATFGGATAVHAPAQKGVFVVSYRADGTLRWLAASDRVDGSVRSLGLALRGDEVVFAGTVSGHVHLGSLDLAGDPDGDGYLAALDAATGATRWTRAIAGPGAEAINSVAITHDGGLAIAGVFTADLEIVPGHPLKMAGSQDGFVAVLDAANRPAWAVGVGGTHFDILRSIGVTRTGYVAVGRYAADLRAGDRTITARGGSDAFEVELDTHGAVTALHNLGGPDGDRARTVAVQPDGAISISGMFKKSLALDGTTIANTCPTCGFAIELRP